MQISNEVSLCYALKILTPMTCQIPILLMLKSVKEHRGGGNLRTSMNNFLKITSSIHPSNCFQAWSWHPWRWGKHANAVLQLTPANPQAVCPLYFCLVLTPSFIWPVKEEIEAHTVRINGEQQKLFVHLTVSGRPSLKRVINAVSYSSSSAWN